MKTKDHLPLAHLVAQLHSLRKFELRKFHFCCDSLTLTNEFVEDVDKLCEYPDDVVFFFFFVKKSARKKVADFESKKEDTRSGHHEEER